MNNTINNKNVKFVVMQNKENEVDEKLYINCHGYILGIIKKFFNYCYEYYEDLYYSGAYGISLAIQKYDINNTSAFISYAYKWIKGEIFKEYNRIVRFKSEFNIYEKYIFNENYKAKLFSDYNIKVLYLLINRKLANIERIIIIYYYGLYNNECQTLQKIANRLGFSKQWVLQMKKNAISKIKKHENLFYF